IENHVAGNKTSLSGVVCVVAEEEVCFQVRSGDFARAPWYVIPGRGLHPIHGQWGSSRPATRTPLGPALLVPSGPRDRMGFHDPSRKAARHPLPRNVSRTTRSALVGG